MRASILVTLVTVGAWGLATPSAESGTLDLLVGSKESDSILRYDGATGAFLGEFASGGGLDWPLGFALGPDGNLYVSGFRSDAVVRYDGVTGQFIDTIPVNDPHGLDFAPDGSLYVATTIGGMPFVNRYDVSNGNLLGSFDLGDAGLDNAHGVVIRGNHFYVSSGGWGKVSAIARFYLGTGGYADTFVDAGSGGLFDAQGFEWGPDGNLYVASNNSSQILRYNGSTGDFIDEFVAPGVGGLDAPNDLTFGPDGNLYVTSGITDEVLRYDGSTGAFLDSFVPAGLGGLNSPGYLNFVVIPEASTALLLAAGGLCTALRRHLR